MSLSVWVLFAISAVLLAGGVEGFSRGVDRLAIPPRFRILLTGFTFALPALLLSFLAGFDVYPKLAVAVLLGSCIANVGIVLALSTLARPLSGSNPQLRLAIPLLLGVTLLTWFLARDSNFSQLDAVFLLIAGVGCVVALIRVPSHSAGVEPALRAPFTGTVLALTGLAWAAGAAVLLIRSCSEENGLIRKLEIGGTAFAIAILCPVLALRSTAAGIHAARTVHGDTALAGVVCGNLITLVLGFGILAVGKPLVITDAAQYSLLPALVIAGLFCLAIRINGMMTRRGEGLLQLAAFVGFVAWLVRKC